MLKILKLPELRKKILFTLFIILVFRLFAHVPVPGVNIEAIRSFLGGNALFGIFDYFSGGGFQNFSIVTLGVGPYISASIIIQLLTVTIPKLEELSKEGESGREKIDQYTRYLTVPISLFQSYSVYFFLSSQGITGELGTFNLLILILTLTAGSLFLVWTGDLVTEYGVGNGVSLLIFVGIISRLPSSALNFLGELGSSNLIESLGFLILAVLVIVSVVMVDEGTRNIQIEYGRRGTGGERVSNYLPIKINQAGVIPIIFALYLVSVPSFLGGPLQSASSPALQDIGFWISRYFTRDAAAYNIFYFLLVFSFTYFYTSVQFDPEKIAEDIKRRGGFIPGIRPGRATTRYLKRVITRLTLSGALFLGLIAVLPYIVQIIMGGGGSYSIGGTGLLIVVSVVIHTVRQVESMMVTRNYDSFLN